MRMPDLGAATALLLLLCATGHAQTVGERLAAQAEIGAVVTPVGTDELSTLRFSFPGGVHARPDVRYSMISGYRELKLDLYLPPDAFNARGPRPLLVYIHGGGWQGGGPRRSAAFLSWPRVLASVAAQGYVVAAVGYRFSREAPFPAQIQDVKSAIRWLRVHATEYNIDPNRAMVWGQSAGGQLAGLAAVTCGNAALAPAPRIAAPGHPAAEVQDSAPPGFDEASDCVQGAVVWFGVFDFAALQSEVARGGPMAAFLGCNGAAPCTPAQLSAPSALTYVNGSDPPILIMHGTDDRLVPIAQSQEFYDSLVAHGVRAEFIKVPDVGHSFLGKSPDATRAASRMALQKTIDFIDATIGDRARH